jgi:hypothetical protein
MFERPSFLLEGDKGEWKAFFSGIPSMRKDVSATRIRFSLALEGKESKEDAETLLRLLYFWVGDLDRGSVIGTALGARLDWAFPEDFVEDVLDTKQAQTAPGEVAAKLDELLAQLPPISLDAASCERPPSWRGSIQSETCRKAFLHRVHAISLGEAGKALYLNLAGPEDSSTVLRMFEGPVVLLIDDPSSRRSEPCRIGADPREISSGDDPRRQGEIKIKLPVHKSSGEPVDYNLTFWFGKPKVMVVSPEKEANTYKASHFETMGRLLKKQRIDHTPGLFDYFHRLTAVVGERSLNSDILRKVIEDISAWLSAIQISEDKLITVDDRCDKTSRPLADGGFSFQMVIPRTSGSGELRFVFSREGKQWLLEDPEGRKAKIDLSNPSLLLNCFGCFGVDTAVSLETRIGKILDPSQDEAVVRKRLKNMQDWIAGYEKLSPVVKHREIFKGHAPINAPRKTVFEREWKHRVEESAQ